MNIRHRVKLKLQFIVYVLFSKSNFKLSFLMRIKLAYSGGFTANQYYLFGLNKNSSEEYLSEYDWFKSRMINKPYDYILNDKFIFHEIVKKQCLTPEIFVIKKENKVIGLRNEINSTEDTLNFIKEKQIIVLKPICGGKGKYIQIIEYQNLGGWSLNGKISCKEEVESLLNHRKDWILCQHVTNHRYSAQIYPDTLNTIRIIVVRAPENNNFVITNAIHRFGTKKTEGVDNASQGGLVCDIDMELGILSEARSIKTLKKYKYHPDTGERIEGIEIPQWQSIKQSVQNLSVNFWYVDMIAWDVALTNQGIYIIEGNSSTGVNIIQLWEGQRSSIFGKFLKSKGAVR